jgi:hypothetical protein
MTWLIPAVPKGKSPPQGRLFPLGPANGLPDYQLLLFQRMVACNFKQVHPFRYIA